MKDIISTLNLVQRLACNLEAEKVSAIERDLALEKLRAIYDLLLGTAAVAEQEPIQDSVIELIEDLVEEVEEFDENDDEVVEDEPTEEEPATEEPAEESEESVIELIEDLVEEVEEFANEDEPEVEEQTENEPGVEAQPEEEKEEVVVEPATAPKTKLAHSAILALYDDDDEEESAPAVEEEAVEEEIEDEVVVDMAELEAEMESAEEEVAEVAPAEEKAEEEIVEEQAEDEVVEEKAEESATELVVEPVAEPVKVVLGDVLGAEQTTLADRIAATATVDVASAVSASKSLAEMIGLNDKFILLRDLFQNNHDYYEAAIDQLDEFDNIDDAMFFIHDNFQWNPNSEGVKLLVELLSNKLL